MTALLQWTATLWSGPFAHCPEEEKRPDRGPGRGWQNMGAHRVCHRDLIAQWRRAIRLSKGDPSSHRRGPSIRSLRRTHAMEL